MKKNKVKEINPTKRAIAWNVADKFVSFTPLAVLTVVQWKEYFAVDTTTGLSNGIGIGLLGLFVALIISKKQNFLKGAGGFVMIFAICFFLRAILNDLVLISGCAAFGQVGSALITKPKQMKWESLKDKTETAEINAKYMNKVQSESEVSARV